MAPELTASYAPRLSVEGTLGGVARLSRLASRVGDTAAHDVARLLDQAGIGTQAFECLSENAEDQLVHATQLICDGKLHEAERILNAIEA